MAIAKSVENPDVSTEILRQAVPQMSALGVPVTPDNYAVWYEYFLGADLDLKRAIDRLISNGVAFTSDVCSGLYKNFIQEQSPETIQNVQIETQILINSLLKKIAQMSAGTETFSGALHSLETELAQEPDVQTLERLIDGIAEHVSSVVEANEQMDASLKEMNREVNLLKNEMENLNAVAMTDQLTSLHNRRAFESEILVHLKQFNELGIKSSMLIVDVDHFKSFNDEHGHLIGDKVLAYVALALKQTVRGDDFVARYGGDEFVIILPNTHFHDALQVAKHLRERIAEKKLSVGKDQKLSLGMITVSIGLTTLHEGDDDKSFFTRADSALYEAKSDGRNCVRGR